MSFTSAKTLIVDAGLPSDIANIVAGQANFPQITDNEMSALIRASSGTAVRGATVRDYAGPDAESFQAFLLRYGGTKLASAARYAGESCPTVTIKDDVKFVEKFGSRYYNHNDVPMYCDSMIGSDYKTGAWHLRVTTLPDVALYDYKRTCWSFMAVGRFTVAMVGCGIVRRMGTRCGALQSAYAYRRHYQKKCYYVVMRPCTPYTATPALKHHVLLVTNNENGVMWAVPEEYVEEPMSGCYTVETDASIVGVRLSLRKWC